MEMELAPELKIALFNGWIFLILFYILQFINVTCVSKQMQEKLFDRSNFRRQQWILTFIGKFFGICSMILIFLTPITNENIEFLLGIGVYIMGMIGLRVSVLNFITTPLNLPVTKGLYKYSRNPQETMLIVIFIGMALIIGSGIVLVLITVSKTFSHYNLIAQEEACIKQYGESYLDYMKQVPRYFLFF
jgi:protein-S-isoprenylcysteine O-methyltransferase Ste14